MEHINRDRADQLAVLEGENIRIETLPNPYMGSRSRKIFGLWDNGEKTSVGWPVEPIPFTRWNSGQETAATVYTLPDTPEQVVDYSMYMGGDMAETVIDTGREELPTLLIYGDSFTNPVESLMYYSFGRMRTIDLRHYHDMSLADYIQLYQPDVVVGIRDYEVLLSTDGNGSVFS